MRSPSPKNETRRLDELRRHEILDTTPEPAFERVVRIAARFFAMPMAAISFVDEYRVWSKACIGLPPGDVGRDVSFCAHTILQNEVLVVRDARLDARFSGNRLVTRPEGMCFYAGAPLWTRGKQALGALCVMDTAPREFTLEDEETLADLAAIVVDELDRRCLTGRLQSEIGAGRRTQRTLTRQHRLLHRLSESLEDRIGLRTLALTRINESLQAEIARRELADAALQQAKKEAERANAAKSEFLSRMSHELRTPLNAILGFGRILQTPVEMDAQRDCANHVVSAGRHLLSLINELLDIARIEAGRVELSLEPLRVSEVIGETLELIRPLAAERRIVLEVSREIGFYRTVLADRRRLKQVLLNLLSNAVKYSPEAGRITVGCRVERSHTLRLSITDKGPGVTREQAERLFTAYDRLGAEHSEIEGTGLGLAVSKLLMEAMGGQIGVKTAPGRGSAFWVRLPLSSVKKSVVREDPVPEIYRTIPAGNEVRTVLYIDDNLSNQHLVEHVLTGHADVRFLGTGLGEEGVELACRQRPDVILLDLHLPDLPGREVLARLRREELTRNIPVVALSADATTATIERIMQAGAQAYLTMPLNIDGLYRILSEVSSVVKFGPGGSERLPSYSSFA